MPKLFAAFAARWRVALLICVTTLVWIAHYDRWTLASWSLPAGYQGDSLEILARIQAASEGDTVPLRPQVISRLGAPFGANWSAYPSSDLLLLWTLGKVAHMVGVFAAANLALLLATVSSAVAFYGCARWLRARWEWAFAGALLFAFTFQTFHRGLAHLFIVFSWTVPLALLSCGLIATSRRLRLRGGMGLFCLATAAVIGISNPYTLFLYLQLLGWAVIAQWLGPRRLENIKVGLIALAIAVAGFVVVESHVWLFAPDSAAASPIVRNYGSTERYALKPIELLLPPATHRWSAFSFLGHRYERWSDWRSGEAFGPYLGIVGIIGLGWLVVVSIRALFRRQRLPGIALPTTWVLAFASVGGVTNMLAFFTTVLVFRATNRFSIFISALVLLFLVMRLTRWLRQVPGWGSVGLAALVSAIGLADQLPLGVPSEQRNRIEQRVAADQDLGARMEQELPDGAMVFQLPIMGFPEVGPQNRLGDYEYFRPYLGTYSLRFTYGSLKGRARGRWQRDIAALPPAEMVRCLERYGFAAIYVDRRGYADRGEKLLQAVAAAGFAKRLDSRTGEQVVLLLKPSLQPTIPLARSLTFGQGWHEERPGQPRWAFGPAALSYFNPTDHALRCHIRLILTGVDARHLWIRVNGHRVLEANVDETDKAVQIAAALDPGANRIDLESVEPPVRLSEGQDQLRAFAVREATITPDPVVLAAQ